jgi:hypothetical protein
MRWCAAGAMQLINFNWNQTDAALDKRIETAQAQLWSVAGGNFRALLGTTLCGIAPRRKIMRVNPSKLAAIKEVNEELTRKPYLKYETLLMQRLG